MFFFNRFAIAVAAIVLFSVGCKQATPAEASGAGGTGSGGASGVAAGSAAVGAESTGGVQTVYVKDPSMNNMNAFAETIPAGWHFQGTLYQGGNCVQIPAAVMRATSQDGLSAVEFLPTYGWVWGTGPAAKAASDCIPVSGAMTADQFVQNLAKTMGLQETGVNPNEAQLNSQAQQQKAAGATVSVGSIFVQSQNGSYTIKGLLTAQVSCTETRNAGFHSILQGMASTPPSDVHKCMAYVNHIYAPVQQFDAVFKLWQAPGMGGHGAENDWFQAYLKRSNAQSQAVIAQGQAITRAGNAAEAAATTQEVARAQQFNADQAVRQQMNDQFIAGMQSSTDASMANANAAMNARSTAASNVVDFALDQQTVVDPSSGQVSKVSSAYTSTWINSAGKTSYQTNDVNANPNGVLPGTWTQQKVVNGNGTPK